MCLLFALSTDRPLFLKHTAVKPPWRDFSTLFFLSSYRRACGVRGKIIFTKPQERMLWCLSNLQSCVYISPETLFYEPLTCTLSRSPFQNHLCISSLPVCWPDWSSLLKVCLESSLRNWICKKKLEKYVDVFGFLCQALLYCLCSALGKVNVIVLSFMRW